MQRIFMLLSIFFTVFSCSNDENILTPAELDDPSKMIVFCQASQEDPWRTLDYKYDNNGNLITEISMRDEKVQSEITYEYDSDNLLTTEVHLTDDSKTEKTFVYNESKQLINVLYKFTNYDSDGNVTNESESEAPREYDGSQLIKEWESWGGFNTYEYLNGKIITEINHTKNGSKHHFTYYKYSGDLLVEEKKENKVGGLIHFKTYVYDSQNRLIQIRDRENIIEESDYNDNKLIEKREYYFGIDPCYSACCGNFIYSYEY
ncbi:hypothetical protein FNH22_31690 [Fulvivirga sp. M361]|uniref:hypothetical protein n=1 Tax=Fulvivirga sp. M361 TaxID=2594266 RepID=UPI00117B0566|nr:hypothetical protein [Fulvivirga sp. M361]TRX44914.1 hypothetical protein FNH22_31690 [Fulvivirga sp. M361]